MESDHMNDVLDMQNCPGMTCYFTIFYKSSMKV